MAYDSRVAELEAALSASETRCERMRGAVLAWCDKYPWRSSPEIGELRRIAAALSAEAAEESKEQAVEKPSDPQVTAIDTAIAKWQAGDCSRGDLLDAIRAAVSPMTQIATAGGDIPPVPIGSRESFYGSADKYGRGEWLSIAEAHRKMAVDYHARLASQQAELEEVYRILRVADTVEAALRLRAEKAEAELARVRGLLRRFVDAKGLAEMVDLSFESEQLLQGDDR